MQKKLIALAIAGLATGAAFADSNVTIYGRVDYGFMSRGSDNGGAPNVDRKNEFGSGLQSGSRLGFKGAEDLGNGLKAIFETEFGIGVDAPTGTTGSAAAWTNRHSYVGLTGGFGTAVGGRLDGIRYGIFNKYDAFGGGGMGNFTQMTAQVDRANNAIAYISPSFSGFSFVLAHATHIGSSNILGLQNQEGGNGAADKGNDGDAKLYSAMVNYANGPIDVTADWEEVHPKSGVATGGLYSAIDKVRVGTLAGSYDFGMVKVSALYDQQKVEGNAGAGTLLDIRSWFVSAKAPVGKFVLKATYGQTKDKETDDSKATKFGIGADYILSKRTNLYASYGRIKNDDASAVMISPGANCYGNTGTVGAATAGALAVSECTTAYGTSGFDIGIAHTF